jgi:V/A-type H+-transporting ATPase subunit K
LSRTVVAPLSRLLRSWMTSKSSFRRRFTLATLFSLVVMVPLAMTVPPVLAQAGTQTTTPPGGIEIGLGLLAAGIAITGSCIGAGYAVAKASSSAAAAIVESPGAFGPMLIFAGLAEGIAIYGLLVAFQILSKIP